MIETVHIALARKPLNGTVAENVLKHGTGAINIDGCRIEGPSWKWGTQTDIRGGGYGSKRPSDGDVFAKNVESNPLGRWPANVVLAHSSECRLKGIKKIKGSATSKKTVENWNCAEECAIRVLDGQSGILTRDGSDKFRNAYGDCGRTVGAVSRFFKTMQIKRRQ